MLAMTSRLKRWLSTSTQLTSDHVWGLFLASLFVLWPDMASAGTLGALICNINHSASGYTRIIGATAFIAGVFIFIRGILIFKKQGENPNEGKTASGIAHFFVGGLLISFPAVVLIMQTSIFGARNQAGTFTCNATGGGAGGAQSLDVMMQNFVANVHGPMFIMLSTLSVIIGVTMIFRALLRGAKTGADPRASNPKDIINGLVIGAILVSIGTVLPDMLQTIFGSPNSSRMSTFKAIQWSNFVGNGVNTTAATNTVRAILAFIQIIGGISFLRGWLILKAAIEGSGQATVPQGTTHIIGGAMAINIDVMLRIIDATFGTGIMTEG